MLNGAKIILSGQDGMTNGHYNNIFQQHTMTVLNIRQLWRSIHVHVIQNALNILLIYTVSLIKEVRSEREIYMKWLIHEGRQLFL